jgi:hypothetical protein
MLIFFAIKIFLRKGFIDPFAMALINPRPLVILKAVGGTVLSVNGGIPMKEKQQSADNAVFLKTHFLKSGTLEDAETSFPGRFYARTQIAILKIS